MTTKRATTSRAKTSWLIGIATRSERVDVLGRLGKRDLRLPDIPPPGGVELGTVPKYPAARVAFGADELEARIRHYAGRAEKRLPLFATGV